MDFGEELIKKEPLVIYPGKKVIAVPAGLSVKDQQAYIRKKYPEAMAFGEVELLESNKGLKTGKPKAAASKTS